MRNFYDEAASLLPESLQAFTKKLSPEQRENACEFRLRTGQFFTVGLSEEEIIPDKTYILSNKDIQSALSVITRNGTHTVTEQIKQGYITAPGGHRVGICGSAALKNGEILLIKDISSLCIRIAREVKGAATGITEKLYEGKYFQNTLIISPPGYGKTTLLRDLIRQLSYGSVKRKPLRISVCDERGELAGCHMGIPALDVGPHTDVLDSAPKKEGAMLLLRSMNPQVLCMDEITDDLPALRTAAGCGVSLLCSAHARDREDLMSRPIYKGILQYFKKLIIIRPNRNFEVSPI